MIYHWWIDGSMNFIEGKKTYQENLLFLLSCRKRHPLFQAVAWWSRLHSLGLVLKEMSHVRQKRKIRFLNMNGTLKSNCRAGFFATSKKIKRTLPLTKGKSCLKFISYLLEKVMLWEMNRNFKGMAVFISNCFHWRRFPRQWYVMCVVCYNQKGA